VHHLSAGKILGIERHIQVGKTARYYVLGPEHGSVDQIWFVLHGYQQLAGRFINRFRTIDDGSRRIVAPEALSRFYVSQAPGRHGPASRVGATWMTREDRTAEIADYVAYLDSVAQAVGVGESSSPEVVVFGFSQGVATAARWAVMGRTAPTRLILWGDHLPPDLEPVPTRAALKGVDVVLARGRRDRVFDTQLGAAEDEMLAALAIDYRVAEYDGGHEIDQRLLKEIAGVG
jgi:predicted esterase